MTDYISRKTFIERVKDIPFWGSVAVLIAEQLPAADVREVKSGKWQEDIVSSDEDGSEIYALFCSECSKAFSRETNFCPNCGADMRENRHEALRP